jgi:malonyl-CoA decarboxylase
LSCRGVAAGKNGMEVMLNLLSSTNYEWTNSAELLSVLKPPLMRLCARYIIKISWKRDLSELEMMSYD